MENIASKTTILASLTAWGDWQNYANQSSYDGIISAKISFPPDDLRGLTTVRAWKHAWKYGFLHSSDAKLRLTASGRGCEHSSMRKSVCSLDWTSLHTFLEVARGGSAAGAAEKLLVDATTVRRRIASLEEALGLTLFVRAGRSWQLSADGDHIRAIVAQMEELSREISRDATDASRDLVGVVRISTMEGFGSYFLAPRLGELIQRHPGLSLQLVASHTILNLSEREADISLNMIRPQRGRLIVRRAGYFGVGLYGSPAYLERAGMPSGLADLQAHEFVTYVDELVSIPHVRWLPDVIADPKIRFACTSLVAQYEAAVEGAGLVMLPVFMARRHAGLVRVMPAEIDLVRDWWLVVHADLQNVPRIRAVITFINEIMRRDQAVLMNEPDQDQSRAA